MYMLILFLTLISGGSSPDIHLRNKRITPSFPTLEACNNVGADEVRKSEERLAEDTRLGKVHLQVKFTCIEIKKE